MSGVELTNVSVVQNSNGILPHEGGMQNMGFVTDTDSETISNYENSNPRISSKKITYTWVNINAWVGPGKSPTHDDSERGSCGRIATGNKVILNNVTGVILPGDLVALIGASGAGKTTLMDILTFRNSRKIKVSGQRAINGKVIESNTITSISAYVQQIDLFIGVLTVREHLIFQALVRMDANVPHQERMNRVEEVIKEFGLSNCADSRIGTKWFKGISGGEMKRLSIATEVLTQPLLMCCDEPTSGLDSNSAQNVIEILKNLANNGKTVICSIHQPSSQLYALFDKVIYMCDGRIAYLGPSSDSIDFFSKLDYECPARYNPADYIIEILAIKDAESKEKAHEICDAFEQTPGAIETKLSIRMKSICGDPTMAHETCRYKASWGTQFRAVLQRSWTSYITDPMVLKIRVIQTIILGLFVGVIYFRQQINHSDGIQNISGAIFMMMISMTYQNLFGVLDCFCSELPVFLREHFNGMYRTDVYFISKILVEIPFYIILPILFNAITYYLVGFDSNFNSFLKTGTILIIVGYICAQLGYTISCVSSKVTVALLLAPVCVFPFFLFGGFLVRPDSGVIFLRWIQYISWFFYGYESIAIIQFEHIDHIICDSPNNLTCPRNGMDILKALNFDRDNFGRDVMALGGLGFGFTVITFLVLLSKTIRH